MCICNDSVSSDWRVSHRENGNDSSIFNLQFAVLGFGLNMKIKLITCGHNFALFRLLSPYSRFLTSLVSFVNLKEINNI